MSGGGVLRLRSLRAFAQDERVVVRWAKGKIQGFFAALRMTLPFGRGIRRVKVRKGEAVWVGE
jgi:hypothetical protein